MQTHNLTETEMRAGLDRVRQLLCDVINPIGCDTQKKLLFNQMHPLTGSKTLLLAKMRGAFDAGVLSERCRRKLAEKL